MPGDTKKLRERYGQMQAMQGLQSLMAPQMNMPRLPFDPDTVQQDMAQLYGSSMLSPVDDSGEEERSLLNSYQDLWYGQQEALQRALEQYQEYERAKMLQSLTGEPVPGELSARYSPVTQHLVHYPSQDPDNVPRPLRSATPPVDMSEMQAPPRPTRIVEILRSRK